MKDVLLTILRNENSTHEEFRLAAEKLANILAYEVSLHLETVSLDVKTPLKKAKGSALRHDVTLIPVLRSGIALLYPFMRLFNTSKVGFIGLKRDEITATPTKYYQNIPAIGPKEDVIILEPMIATGGSAGLAIQTLQGLGIKEQKIILASVVASSQGLAYLHKIAPKTKIVVAAKDPSLSPNKFIVPGLGDFGDRYFRTEG